MLAKTLICEMGAVSELKKTGLRVELVSTTSANFAPGELTLSEKQRTLIPHCVCRILGEKIIKQKSRHLKHKKEHY